MRPTWNILKLSFLRTSCFNKNHAQVNKTNAYKRKKFGQP